MCVADCYLLILIKLFINSHDMMFIILICLHTHRHRQAAAGTVVSYTAQLIIVN